MNLNRYFKRYKKIVNYLFKHGVIPYNVMLHFQIYNYYDDCLNLKIDKKKSIELTMDYYSISQRTMYNVINLFES